jgi:aryl-alcohol dehydrogenase-like predicted oxidoreductase
MHWPDSTTPIEETMEALEILKQQGKIKAAGVCNCPVDLLQKAIKILPVATNQVGYSMVNRGIEKELVPFCLENNIGILPHTSLQKGLLTGKIKPGHQFGEGDHRAGNIYFNKHNHNEIMNLLKAIQPIAEERSISLAQLAINWTMQQPAVTSVLVGARNAEQMLDNVKAASFVLSSEELNSINDALAKMDLKL